MKTSVLDARLALVGILLAGVCASPMASASIATGEEKGLPPQGQAQEPVDPDKVDFAANTVSYDETNQTIVAEGDVEIAQDGKIVRAQKVVYDLPKDKVEASGDVVMMDQNGDVHFADQAQLERKLKDGYIKKLRSVLADGSRITASEGRKDGKKTVMKDASYTACKECKDHPERPAIWRIVADKVTHNEETHSMTYRDAKFEVYGVPVMYTPYFSHSDGTVKQKSGFLPPKLSLNSQLGFGFLSTYYWGINPSEDATIGARVFSKESPQLLGEYRKRFEDAQIKFNSSATYSNNDQEFRGHLFGKGVWDVNEKWRAGFNTQMVTDDTYLKEYGVTSDSVLENELYVERFDNRNYFVTRGLAFQDVRVSDRAADQPNILPEMQASFIGKPNDTLGGRWEAEMSSLSLMRNGGGQDVWRLSGTLGWERRDVLPIGLVNTFNVSSRGDLYQISDRDVTSIVGGEGGPNAFRFYPVVHDVITYPLVKTIGSKQVVIEPTLALTSATTNKNSSAIPNEDSQDVQIDTANIFDANRFPGIDRVEDGTHATYGARAGIYEDDGSKWEVFLGQSYRLDSQDNPFPNGSGLSQRDSDIVGQIIARYKNQYDVNYRVQLASDNFQSERHELDTHVNLGDFALAGTYLYARALDGTDLQESRQQVYGSASYKMDEEWVVSSSARYDLSSQDEGLRYAGLGLTYLGQCFNVLTNVKRSFTNDNTGDNATEVTIQLGFKNLGSFGNTE